MSGCDEGVTFSSVDRSDKHGVLKGFEGPSVVQITDLNNILLINFK